MVQYHFRPKDGPSVGPIDDVEFQRRREVGEIVEETMVWRSGMLEWTTYASLRASEEQLQRRKSAEPPPLPAQQEAAAPASRPAVSFRPCGFCGQEWPDHLLFEYEKKPICGNCQRRKKDDPKHRPVQKDSGVRVSSGWGAWLMKCIVLAVIFGGLLFARTYLKYKRLKGLRILHKEGRSLTEPAR